jgi:hypothetical protein
MMIGMNLATFTLLHVLISLVGIAAGLVAMIGLLKSNLLRAFTGLFLATTILTSVTGFLFPFAKLLPSHIVGILSIVTLAVAAFALYAKHLSGVWRLIYVITAMVSLYLNVFVLIVQSFLKIEPLRALAPTQTEPAFLAAQGAALLLFVAITILATLRFRPMQLSAV